MTLTSLLLTAAILPPTAYLALLYWSSSATSGPTDQHKRSTGGNEPLKSVLIPSYTSHARLLPIPTKHTFSYPLLHLGIDVDELESNRLDLPWRLFNFGGSPWWKVLGLRSDGYLVQGRTSLRQKVTQLLLDHQGYTSPQANLDEEPKGREINGTQVEGIGRIWMVTMPSFLGFEGINPLTVWYIHVPDPVPGDKDGQKAPRGRLAWVILEVHNTFGERYADCPDYLPPSYLAKADPLLQTRLCLIDECI